MVVGTSLKVTTLFDLGDGAEARIVRINARTPQSLRRRLLDMGITAGAELRVERHAPLGDPMQIAVKGYRLAVRLSDARNIEVTLLSDSRDNQADQ